MRRRLATAAICALGLTALVAPSADAAAAREATAPTPVAGPTPAPLLGAGQQAVVRYCDGQKALVTEPATWHRRAPVAVYVHGGSWVAGNYDSGGSLIDAIRQALTAKGFVVVGVDYRLGPRNPWPDQIDDVKCAIRYVRHNARRLGVDPAAVGAWGQSAGGQLAALLGTAGAPVGWDVGPYLDESSRVEAVVDISGPSDLLTMGTKGDALGVARSFLSLLRPYPDDQLGFDLKTSSPVTYVAPGDPPFLILDGSNDEIVSPHQSQELAWDLGANGVPRRLVTVARGGHALDTRGESPSESALVALVVDFFERTLVGHVPISSN